jgi:hypothetical protein
MEAAVEEELAVSYQVSGISSTLKAFFVQIKPRADG